MKTTEPTAAEIAANILTEMNSLGIASYSWTQGVGDTSRERLNGLFEEMDSLVSDIACEAKDTSIDADTTTGTVKAFVSVTLPGSIDLTDDEPCLVLQNDDGFDIE